MKPHHIQEIISLYDIDNCCLDDISKKTGLSKDCCEHVIETYDYLCSEMDLERGKHRLELEQKDIEISELQKELADFYKAVAKRLVYGTQSNKHTVKNQKLQTNYTSPFKDDRE